MATLKVLGFYDREVAEYVYRENILLTSDRSAGGAWDLERYFTWLLLRRLEVDAAMFGRIINLPSYIYSLAFTVGVFPDRQWRDVL